jgi:hypothetical protein
MNAALDAKRPRRELLRMLTRMNGIKTMHAISDCARFWRLCMRMTKVLTRSVCYRQNDMPR